MYTILILIALVGMLAYAQTSDAPALPSYFYGKATYNGKNVPVGAVITAKIDNEKRGSIKVDAAGFYGSETSDKKLGVTGSRSSLGKNIEFYVKIPKLQEIKATQTSKWQVGTETKLDLTFNGQEIVDNSTEILEEVVNSTKQSFSYARITANSQVLIFIENPLIPIIRLQLLTTANLTNVTFDFEVVEQPNAPKLEGVYKYISINVPKIQDSIVKTAILRFKVPNEWLEINGYDPTTVKLLRYSNNQWNELQTFHEGADATDNYYRAGTPGFSYFAIKAGKYVPSANSTVTAKNTDEKGIKEQAEKDAEKNGNETFSPIQAASQITGFAVEKVKTNPIIGVMLVLVGVLLGILITYYFVGKNKAEQDVQTIDDIQTGEESQTMQEIQAIDDIQDQETHPAQEIQSIDDLEEIGSVQAVDDIQIEQETQQIQEIQSIEDLETIDGIQATEDIQTEQETEAEQEIQTADDIQYQETDAIQEIKSLEDLQTIEDNQPLYDIQTEQKPQAIYDVQEIEDAQTEEDKQETKIKLEVK